MTCRECRAVAAPADALRVINRPKAKKKRIAFAPVNLPLGERSAPYRKPQLSGCRTNQPDCWRSRRSLGRQGDVMGVYTFPTREQACELRPRIPARSGNHQTSTEYPLPAATRIRPLPSTSCGDRRQRRSMNSNATCGASQCSEVRGYPYKRSHLVALRATKITASDPPSTWWPGGR